MKSFNEILFEIYAGEEAAHDFHRRYNEQLEDVVFLLKNSKGKGKLPWQKVRAARLAKIWLDFGKSGIIRDEKGLDEIVDLILDNIARLRVTTEMMGHTPINSREDLKDREYEFTDEEWDVWMRDYFTHEDGSCLLSDYGLPKLEKLYGPLFYADTPEKKLYAVDRILNVIHQRSDLASLFVEGGTKTLLKISSQGGYSSIDELMLENILSESYGDIKKKKWKLENPTLDDSIIDKYINQFNIIRKSKPAESKGDIKGLSLNSIDRFDIDKYKNWSEFETFVDYVVGQRSLKKIGDEKLEFDATPLIQHKGIEIYYADSKRACIKYKGNVPYSWCISRSDASNMYYTYRFKSHQPAFYFVKNVEKTTDELERWDGGQFDDPYHFFVIQVTKNATLEDNYGNNYIVTSANNDGDVQMSWNDILTIEPGLKDLKKYFEPKPLTAKEEETYDKYKSGITNEEFFKLSYEEKESYLDIYPSSKNPISNEQFQVLPYDLKNKYIGFGIGLTDIQYDTIKNDKKLSARYSDMAFKRFKIWFNNFSGDDYEDATLSNLYPNEIKILMGEIEKNKNKITDGHIYSLMKSVSGDFKIELSKFLINLLKSSNSLNIARAVTATSPLTVTNILEVIGNKLEGDEKIITALAYFLTRSKYANQEELKKRAESFLEHIFSVVGNGLIDTTIDELFSTSPYFVPKLIEYVLKNKSDNLSQSNIYDLMRYSGKDRLKMADYIINLKKSTLTDENVSTVLAYIADEEYKLTKSVQIMEILKNTPQFTSIFKTILKQNSQTKFQIKKIIDYFLKIKGRNLNSEDIRVIMNLSVDPGQAAMNIIDLKGSDLSNEDAKLLVRMTRYSEPPVSMQDVVAELEKLGFKYENLRESIMDESSDKPSDITSDPKNNDRTLSDITSDFIQHGGEVNRGSYGVVLTKNDWNFALKIFNDDIPYLKFVRFCLKNSRPSFPKFLDKPRRIIPNFKREKSKYYLYVVKVEKLKPITNSEYLDIDFYINYGGVNFDEMPDNHVWNKTKKKIEEIEKKYPTINQFLVDYNFLMDNGREFGSPDIGESNIMKRNNGEFVLSDPFWAGETPYQTHDRLMKSEMDDHDYSAPEMVKGGEKLKSTKKPKVLPKVQSPEEDVPFEESVLKEGYNLPNDVDVELENVAKFIGSLFRPIFKKRIEHGKQKHRSQIVMQHKHYFIAEKYRNETKDLFVIKRERKSGAIWGHTDFTIRSKRDIIPPIYLYITDGYSVSTSGMVNLDDNRVCILIDKSHFLQNISDSVDDLTDTLKHEIRHYFQVTGHKTNYIGTPKKRVLSTTSDFFGNVHDSNRSVRHHMRDIEFKTNVHTYAHYFKKYLHLNYAKKDWLSIFKDIITGKSIKNSQYMTNYLENIDDMRRRDKPRWKQFVKEIYKEIFI